MSSDTIEHEASHGHHEAPEVVEGRQRLGIWLFIVGDVIMLASFLFTYLYLRGTNTQKGWMAYLEGKSPVVGFELGDCCGDGVERRSDVVWRKAPAFAPNRCRQLQRDCHGGWALGPCGHSADHCSTSVDRHARTVSPPESKCTRVCVHGIWFGRNSPQRFQLDSPHYPRLLGFRFGDSCLEGPRDQRGPEVVAGSLRAILLGVGSPGCRGHRDRYLADQQVAPLSRHNPVASVTSRGDGVVVFWQS